MFPGRNHKIIQDGAYTTYRHYDTDVVKVSRCGSHVVIAYSPIKSISVKNAINEALRISNIPMRVYQKKFRWRLQRTSSVFHGVRDCVFFQSVTIKLI